MAFLLSIHGSSFEPYSKVEPVSPRYSHIRETQASQQILPLEKNSSATSGGVGRSFSELLASAKKIVYQKEAEKIQHDEKHAHYAQHIMTPDPVSVFLETKLEDIQSLFSLKGFRHLPVINKDQSLLGMISDRDVLPWLRARPEEIKKLTAKDVMTDKVLAATPDTLLLEVANAMLSEKISALPILNSENKLIGILTTSDILKGLLRRAPVELWV